MRLSSSPGLCVMLTSNQIKLTKDGNVLLREMVSLAVDYADKEADQARSKYKILPRYICSMDVMKQLLRCSGHDRSSSNCTR